MSATAQQAALHEVAMPRLSDSMEEGTVLSWLKQVGEQIAVGEEIVEIETDKATMPYESEVAGTLVEVLVPDGAVAAVGAVIARVAEPGWEPGAAPAQTPAKPVEAPPAQAADRAPARAATTASTPDDRTARARAKASPLARRIAADLGVDLAALAGSGPGGRIVRVDVEAAAVPGEAPAPAAETVAAPATVPAESGKGAVELVEPTRLQQVVARRMAEAKATAPHFYLQTEVDMTAAVAARQGLKRVVADGAPVPSFNDMAVKACALALREHPRANGAYRDGRWELYGRVNVGIAVAAEGALVVPTIADADRKGLAEIAAEARRLAARVREGAITPPELAGATFTVSNLGMFGVRSFQAVLNAPQAAILAVGEIAERPVVRDGQVVPGHVMALTLSCDHRILYGADGARFLARVRDLLEQPLGLAL